MYRLTRSLPPHRLLRQQLPTLGGALLLSELFFKFHSFTLECVAFLATWYALDALTALATAGHGQPQDPVLETRTNDPSPDSNVA